MAVGQEQGCSAIALVGFDVDLFKQVNDSHGHQYGDIVLMAVAKRLRRARKRLDKSLSDKASFILGHPSGEEFFVLIISHSDDIDIRVLANEFRKEVCSEPLPSEAEWSELKDHVEDGFTLPERREVSVSGGLSSIKALQGKDFWSVVKKMTSDADVALQRAKAAGRNCIVSFDSIIQSHAHIIEHDKDVEIVALDVGARVNVKPGSQFIVYSKKYDGTSNFTISDGRSSKIIGLYPEVVFGRVEVFGHPQDELSFARVVDNKFNVTFGRDFALKLASPGDIVHLIYGEISPHQTPKMSADIADIFTKRSVRKAETNDEFLATNVQVANINEAATEHGTSMVNGWIADLYNALIKCFPASSNICQKTPGNFLIFAQDAVDENSIVRALGEVSENAYGMLSIAVGVMDGREHRKKPLAKTRVVECSEIAGRAAVAASEVGKVVIKRFVERDISALIHKLTGTRSYSEIDGIDSVLSDIEMIGPETENQFGIALVQRGKSEEAIERFQNAARLGPDVQAYVINRGIAYARLGKAAEAFADLSAARAADPKAIDKKSPAIWCAWIGYKAFKAGVPGVDLPVLKADLTKALKFCEEGIDDTNASNLSKAFADLPE